MLDLVLLYLFIYTICTINFAHESHRKKYSLSFQLESN